MMTNRVDCRKVTGEALSFLKRTAVERVSRGETQADVARALGLSTVTLCLWMKDFRERGAAAFEYKRRGPAQGVRLLTLAQQSDVIDAILNSMPDELGLTWFLWTRGAVAELIESRWGLRVSLNTVGKWLRNWDFTPQKPCRKALEQNPELVEHWLNSAYPRIQNEAKSNGAIVLWCDESGFRTDDQVGRSYGLRNHTPAAKVSGKRLKYNMISALSNSGEFSFMLFPKNFNSDVFIEFLTRLLKEYRQNIVLIVDNYGPHTSRKTRDFVAAQNGRIKLEYLPPYSPELNPDEYVNHDFKANALRRKRARTAQELHDNLLDYANRRKSEKSAVKKYFNHPKVKYAA